MKTRAVHVTAAILVMVSVLWLVGVVVADGAHGPFGIWDTTCRGVYSHGDGRAIGWRRVEYSLAAVAGLLIAALLLAAATRRGGLGCALCLLIVIALGAAFMADLAAAERCSF